MRRCGRRVGVRGMGVGKWAGELCDDDGELGL